MSSTVIDACPPRARRASAARLIGPGDADYEERARRLQRDDRPAARADRALRRAPDDVAQAIAFAREHDLLARDPRRRPQRRRARHRATTASSSTSRRCKDIEVDPQARTVRVGGGCTWGEVDRATGEHGLATPSGIISTTGVGGLTLGGGLGHLTRKFGLTIDNLLEADVVLADGRARPRERRRAPRPVLGAARRRRQLRRRHLVPVPAARGRHRLRRSDVLADRATAPRCCRAYRDFLPAAPRELNGFFAFRTVPPGPPFPEELHLREVCGVVWCYVGGEDGRGGGDGAAARRAARAAAARRRRRCRTPRSRARSTALYPAGDQWYWRADFVNEIPDEAVRAARPLRRRDADAGSRRCTCTRSTARRTTSGASDTAWSYRDARWATVFAGVDPDPANVAAIREWSVDYHEALHPYSAGGAYVNMMMDEGRERVRASYRDNYDRLARVKAAYDPDNTLPRQPEHRAERVVVTPGA